MNERAELSVNGKSSYKGAFMLLFAAFIWGISFVAQSVGMQSIEAFTFSGIRTLMGAMTLVPFLVFSDRAKMQKMREAEKAEKKLSDKKALRYGFFLGLIMCIASNLQQFAFIYSSPGKIAFITSLYMFFVPLIGIFLGKKTPVITWICAVFAFVGLYFLCIDPSLAGSINKGDLLTAACAVFFAFHIIFIEKYAPEVCGIRLSMIQFAVSGFISCILMLIFETPRLSSIMTALPSLLYSGVLSCGLAYTLQVLGQRHTEATVASLLLSTESVFAVLASALLLGEIMKSREILGCVIMFAAIIISQLSEKITQKVSRLSSPAIK
ncbi:MAG: DMT family transporter [Ruminococcaceae bacterium]|nr:DMT family transporter [Oscillospiraceae bacterium]